MPRQKKLDPETRKVFEHGKRVKELTEHAGWNEVRTLFIKKSAELLNMKDINVLDKGQDFLLQIGARQLAAARLIEILNDIQGTAEQFDANATLTEEITSSYVIRRDQLL